MEIKNFKGANVTFAKDQGEYRQLPALKTIGGEVFSCHELTDDELEIIKNTRRIYLSQLTFNQPLQPIRLFCEYHPTQLYWQKKQSRKFIPGKTKNNPWATAIACLTGARDAEQVLQVDLIDHPNRLKMLDEWLEKQNYRRIRMEGELMTGEVYMIYGAVSQSDEQADVEMNACLYIDGEMVWDTHPFNRGVSVPMFIERYVPTQDQPLK